MELAREIGNTCLGTKVERRLITTASEKRREGVVLTPARSARVPCGAFVANEKPQKRRVY